MLFPVQLVSRWCFCDRGLCGLGPTLRFVLTFSPSCLWKFWWSLDWSCWVSRTTNIILCRGWWLQIPLVSDTFEFLEFPEHLCIWAVACGIPKVMRLLPGHWKVAGAGLATALCRWVSQKRCAVILWTALLWNMAILRVSSRFLKTMLGFSFWMPRRPSRILETWCS